MFPGINIDQLNEQFLNYQLCSEAEIPKEVKANINLSEEDPYCVDVLWGFLCGVKNLVQVRSSLTCFSRLLKS